MLIVGIVLLLVIGASGLAVGIGLVALIGSVVDLPSIGIAIGSSIAAYGLITAVAGIGLLLRRARAAWWLAVVAILAGLLFLVGLVVSLGGIDPVFAFGIAVWSLTLACLLVPGTRAAVGFGRSLDPGDRDPGRRRDP